MRKYILLLFIIPLFMPNNQPAFSWGFFAHKKINRMAVFTLPPGMIPFYKMHIDYIANHAVDPDKRRGVSKDEAPKHYIDIDHYGSRPFDSVPKNWDAAIKKFSIDTLNEYGIVPWHIEKMVYRLQKAFMNENLDLILHYSADLGHYVADAHVPLHTTENYNGQLTNQKGIHGFWESRIPELKSDNYDYWTGKAEYINKPLNEVWKIITASHAAVDSVLKFEATLNAKYATDKKYSFESRGQKTIKVYSVDYTNEYNNMLNGMVERRMRQSIITVGNLWYTAWVNAGKPDLNNLRGKTISDSLKKAKLLEVERWNARTITEIKGH